MGFGFRKLIVYEASLDLIDAVYEMTRNFPPSETPGLVTQLRRAAVSIIANLAEGAGRETGKDRRRFYRMARGSVFECVALLEVSARRKFVYSPAAEPVIARLEAVSKMVSGLIRALRL